MKKISNLLSRVKKDFWAYPTAEFWLLRNFKIKHLSRIGKKLRRRLKISLTERFFMAVALKWIYDITYEFLTSMLRQESWKCLDLSFSLNISGKFQAPLPIPNKMRRHLNALILFSKYITRALKNLDSNKITKFLWKPQQVMGSFHCLFVSKGVFPTGFSIYLVYNRRLLVKKEELETHIIYLKKILK